jgi:SAM-dependent methyltransferase
MTTYVDRRDEAALRRHYEIEKELADRLRAATPNERPALYRSVYDELFLRVPDHPQNVWKAGPEEQATRTAEQLGILHPFLCPESVYVEVGCGDGHLACIVAGQVWQSYGVDVSPVIANSADNPANYTPLYCRDGVSITLPDDAATVVFSNMLLEHLHPQDALRHLGEVFRVLRPGGVYVCRTPHRFAGPTDISGYFDNEATGFHLKEYTLGEVRQLFGEAGFTPLRLKPRVMSRAVPVPLFAATAIEPVLGCLPHRLRRWLSRSPLLRPLFSTITIAAYKPLPVKARTEARTFTLALA